MTTALTTRFWYLYFHTSFMELTQNTYLLSLSVVFRQRLPYLPIKLWKEREGNKKLGAYSTWLQQGFRVFPSLPQSMYWYDVLYLRESSKTLRPVLFCQADLRADMGADNMKNRRTEAKLAPAIWNPKQLQKIPPNRLWFEVFIFADFDLEPIWRRAWWEYSNYPPLTTAAAHNTPNLSTTTTMVNCCLTTHHHRFALD